MAVVISNFAWVKKSELPVRTDIVMRVLTIVPKSTWGPGEVVRPIRLYRENGEYIGVPRAWFLERHREYAMVSGIEDQTTRGTPRQLNTKDYAFRPEQLELVDRVVSALKDEKVKRYGGLVVAPGGFGKTITCVRIIKEMSDAPIFPVLVVVHRRYLIEQWRREIERYLDNIEVGTIIGRQCVEGAITLAMLETLATEAYTEDFLRKYAFVIFDEVHRISTPVYHKVIGKLYARWILGVTATVRRPDNTHSVYLYSIGSVIGETGTKRIVPKIRLVKVPRCVVEYKSYGDLIRRLCNSPVRNQVVAREIARLHDMGKWVIVLSDRIKHLEVLKNMARRGGVILTGGATPQEIAEAKKQRIIYSTFQYLAEGFDDPKRDGLVMATPKSHVVEQACGRVMRTHEGKEEVVIVDFWDEIPILKNLLNKRIKKYKSIKGGSNVKQKQW